MKTTRQQRAVDMLAFVNRDGDPCLRVKSGDLSVYAIGRESVEGLFAEVMGGLTDEWWQKHGGSGEQTSLFE